MNRPPFIPEDISRRGGRPYLERAAYAMARAYASTSITSPEAFARQRWGDSITELLLTRAATGPGNLGNMGWAGDLARDAVGGFIGSLAPISAGAKVLDAATKVSLDGVYSIDFPQRIGPLAPNKIPWVAELDPAPVISFPLKTTSLGPVKKLVAIAIATRELLESSAGEAAISTMLRESTAMSLDATLFSNAPATAAKPAGLLTGITALTPTAAGAGAMNSDLSALAGAIGSVTSGLALVMNPAQAMSLRIARGPTFPEAIPIWTSIAVPAGTVIALDPAALATGYGAAPEIDVDDSAMLVLDDAPGQNPMAGPSTQSLFQQDLVATRVRLSAAWTWRVTGAVAWVSGVTW